MATAMRIYIRQEPLRRPTALDIGPCLSVGELRAHVGAEALFLATRAGTTPLCGIQESESCDGCVSTYANYGSHLAATAPLPSHVGPEPLDDASLVMDIVPPHGTLTVGARPLPGMRSTPSVLPPTESRRIAPGYAHGGQWHLTKNPTPLVTSTPRPPGARRFRPLLAAGAEALGRGPGGLSTSTDIADAAIRDRLFSDGENDMTASHISGTCASLQIGGLEEAALRAEELFLAPPRVDGNSTPAPPGGQPERLHGEPFLGEDWDDLSVVEEVVDDQTISERGAWSLASEIVHKALISEDGMQSPEAMFTFLSDELPASDGTRPRPATESPGTKLPSGPRWQSLSEEIQGTIAPGSDQGQAESLVFAWGDNSSGQCLVGDARRIVENPEHVPLRCLCTSLCCGSECSILVTKRGTLWGGGSNAGGTLSEDAGPGSLSRPTYVDLAELENFDLTAVAAGSEHVLAVTESGVLLAWAASNSDGQAGVGSELARAGPVLPRTLAWPAQLPSRPSVRVATVACGEWHSLALTDSGEVYAFGSNASGQLGLGERVQRSLGPAAVSGKARGVPFRAIAAGMRHSLALTVSGALYSWGDNSMGCLGLGAARCEQTMVPLPSPVLGLPGPGRHVAAGGKHSAVIVWKGRLLLAGDNEYGQLGQLRALVPMSHTFCELEPRLGLSVRSVALGHEHSLLLTYDGQLHAFGRNGEGQCGPPCAGKAFSEVPVNVQLPRLPGQDTPLIWAVAAGRNHNLVLCSPGSQAERHLAGSLGSSPRSRLVMRSATMQRDREACPHVRSPVRRATAEPLPGRRWQSVVGVDVEPAFLAQASTSHPETAAAGSFMPEVAAVLQEVHQGTTTQNASVLGQEPPKSSHQLVTLRPIAQPGVAPRAFTALSVPWLACLLAETASQSPKAGSGEFRQLLVAVLARPSVLNASFCYPGLRTARLDAAGLCKTFAVLCTRIQGLGQQLLDAAAEGLQVLTSGPMEDLLQRDQLRALVVYLCLPVHRTVPSPGPQARSSKSILSRIAHAVMRMSAAGRAALRDLVADECGDVRILRDFLVPHVRSLAEDAIRNVGQQPWLAGPLWEVVAQLQLQRSLWEAVLLLQVLASASEHAALLLSPGRSALMGSTGSADAQPPLPTVARSESSSVGSGSGPLWNATDGSLLSLPNIGTSQRRSSSSLLDPSAFQLTSLTEGAIPPEVEFWLFQEHAQFHQITPTEVIDEPWWSDAAGMLPRRFCSFMAHANLVPIAFKQRVLQVENVLRQRLSQEQVLPQAALVLGGVRADPTAFYFMLSVSRQNLLGDTFAQMYSASPVDLRRPLRVEFAGEEAIDEGGVMREFFRLLSIELFAPAAGLFFEADDSRRLWFSPVLGSGRQLEDYWMVGVIVALAVYNNHPGMDVPLPSALFKKLKDVPTTHDDLVQLFPPQARSLEAILNWKPSKPVDSEAALEEADREFMDTFCLGYCFAVPSSTSMATSEQVREAPLCEGGLNRPVLYRDREEFVTLVHEYLLHKSVQPQFESFARGFRRVCNSPLFDVLSPEELEAIVAGDKDLDFSRLRQGVQYEGYSASEDYVQSLWTVLEGFSMLRRRRFLAFCTGSDVAPAGGLQDLHLLVQKHGEEPTMRLPVAHTCFNLLLLPKYSSVEKLQLMLITAIEWTEGFGLQ